MIHINADSNGREVSAAVGETLEISLAENRTTGFRWELKSKAETACILVKDAAEPAKGPPGKGGTHRWQFQAVRPGTGEIELEYRRPWERDAPPQRTFQITVRVEQANSTPPSE
ncbi:MAG TPA: protease inhibitor I42 family protein [Terriglobia bacterium]|nr:protease inhibitor I42 family protein [Terriglobia bacterium]